MPAARPFSAKALETAIREVVETGVSVTIKSKDVVCEIRPPERPAPVNPADLIEP